MIYYFVSTSEVDYEAWTVELCNLLDRIEAALDDPDRIHGLCHERFDMARRHGITVEVGGEAPRTLQ